MELQGAAQIAVDGRWREQMGHCGRVGLGLRVAPFGALTSLQRAGGNGVGSLHHQLQQETAHLALLAIGSAVVVDNGDIICTLQQPVEVVAVDGHLLLGGGEAVGAAHGVGYERGVGGSAWQVPLAGREHQEVAEVQVACL